MGWKLMTSVRSLKPIIEKVFPMSELITVSFQAKMLTILRYVELTEERSRNCIYICSDSRAAIGVLAKISTETPVIWNVCKR